MKRGEKPRRGRPPLDPEGTEIVRARVTPAGREELDAIAAELGDVGDSTAIRWLLEQSARRRARRQR